MKKRKKSIKVVCELSPAYLNECADRGEIQKMIESTMRLCMSRAIANFMGRLEINLKNE